MAPIWCEGGAGENEACGIRRGSGGLRWACCCLARHYSSDRHIACVCAGGAGAPLIWRGIRFQQARDAAWDRREMGNDQSALLHHARREERRRERDAVERAGRGAEFSLPEWVEEGFGEAGR